MIRRYLTAITAALLSFAALLLYRKGHKDADDANETEDLNEYVETRKHMDAVDDSGSDAEWLRERSKRGGDL